MEEFLDRLMVAESGGHPNRRNPRSTALGPFQFIESTFLHVVGRHFPSEVAGRSELQVLTLRTSLDFSRRAARAYASDLISHLKAQDLPATTVNVRLAFLVGPYAAVRLLRAPPDQPLQAVLSADAIAANPFMSRATIAKLVRKAATDIGGTTTEPSAVVAPAESPAAVAPAEPAAAVAPAEPAAILAALQGEPASAPPLAANSEPAATIAAEEEPASGNGPPTAVATPSGAFEIKCETALASCRRWIALQERKARLLAASNADR